MAGGLGAIKFQVDAPLFEALLEIRKTAVAFGHHKLDALGNLDFGGDLGIFAFGHFAGVFGKLPGGQPHLFRVPAGQTGRDGLAEFPFERLRRRDVLEPLPFSVPQFPSQRNARS